MINQKLIALFFNELSIADYRFFLTEPIVFPKIYHKDACGIKNNNCMNKKKKSKIILIALIVLALPLLVYFSLDLYLRFENPIGYKNHKIFGNIPVGTQLQELIKILGEPTRSYAMNGNIRYEFSTISIAAGPISAFENNNKVIELRCSEDGPSTWKINHN